jgi:DNA-binding transcriptional MerR regulator
VLITVLQLPIITSIIGSTSREETMTALLNDKARALGMIEQVNDIEAVAKTLDEGDDRRQVLLSVVAGILASADPIRASVVAEILSLSEKTIRAWVSEGVLTKVDTRSPRLLLEPSRVHQVQQLLEELRMAGKTAGLLDEVHRRLVDATWLDRQDLAESLDQMRRGEGTPETGQ